MRLLKTTYCSPAAYMPKGPHDLPGHSLSHRRLLLLLSHFSRVQLCATP